MKTKGTLSAGARIALNVVATYGRSLYALALGLLSVRWALQALGKVDYGLYGVIGGLTVFIAFFNLLLGGAIGRFYAVSVGKAQKPGCAAEGLEECRKWFNTALAIHTVVPAVLIAIGYPIGVWAIRNWMTVPPDRVAACVWAFRFVCVTSFFTMVNVPFNAMYIARQYIAELTVYSFVSTTLSFALVGFMVTHPGDWLARYACGMMFIMSVPEILICCRAFRIFPECRIVRAYLFSRERMGALAAYAFWQFFGSAGVLVRNEGMALLVNRRFGPALNSTMAISTGVANHADALSTALTGAFSPAIMNAEGRGERGKMIAMSCQASRFGALLCLLFIVPLSLEINTVLDLWLVEPPPVLGKACLFTFGIIMIDQFARGLVIAINASGRVSRFNFAVGLAHVLSLPVACVLVVLCGRGFRSVLGVLLAFKFLGVLLGAVIAAREIAFPVRHWVRRVILPVAVTGAVGLSVGAGIKYLLPLDPLVRLFVQFPVLGSVLLVLAFFLVLDRSERRILISAAVKILIYPLARLREE